MQTLENTLKAFTHAMLSNKAPNVPKSEPVHMFVLTERTLEAKLSDALSAELDVLRACVRAQHKAKPQA